MKCVATLMTALLILAGSASPASAASPADVKAAIAKGASFLRVVAGKSHGGEKTLVALALLKSGAAPDSPEIREALDEVLKKFGDGKYQAGGHHIYEAGVEATLLTDLDAERYKPQIQLLADYIVGQQKNTGGWDYPSGHPADSPGDTSVIQYALLGLWAAERAGVKVNPLVWQRTLEWHAQYQSKDGGFAYIPGFQIGDGQGNSTLNMSVNAVGSMHRDRRDRRGQGGAGRSCRRARRLTPSGRASARRGARRARPPAAARRRPRPGGSPTATPRRR